MDNSENDQRFQRRNKLIPVKPLQKPKPNEIQIKSDLKSIEIQNLIDKIIHLLLNQKLPFIILKGMNSGLTTLNLIFDILKRKISGLTYYQRTYYSTEYSNIEGKEINLPCKDITLKVWDTSESRFNQMDHSEYDSNQNSFRSGLRDRNAYTERIGRGFRARGRESGVRGRGKFGRNLRGRVRTRFSRGRGMRGENRVENTSFMRRTRGRGVRGRGRMNTYSYSSYYEEEVI